MGDGRGPDVEAQARPLGRTPPLWKWTANLVNGVSDRSRTIWDLWGPSGDHLGHGFEEVIGFITDPDLPECADRSVSSSEYRWSEN